MWKRKILYSALGALVAVSANGYASDYERTNHYAQRGPMPFELMDVNGDGVITAAEHEQSRAKRQEVRAAHGYPMRRAASAPKYEQIDLDDNGSIDPDELSAWRDQRRQQRGPGCGGRWRG